MRRFNNHHSAENHNSIRSESEMKFRQIEMELFNDRVQ